MAFESSVIAVMQIIGFQHCSNMEALRCDLTVTVKNLLRKEGKEVYQSEDLASLTDTSKCTSQDPGFRARNNSQLHLQQLLWIARVYKWYAF